MAERFGHEYVRKLSARGFQGGRIPDAGCGFGSTALVLAEAFPAGQVVGIDLSAPLLEIAREAGATADVANRVRFEKADVRQMPYADAHFDVIINTNGVHLVARPARMLDEIERDVGCSPCEKPSRALAAGVEQCRIALHSDLAFGEWVSQPLAMVGCVHPGAAPMLERVGRYLAAPVFADNEEKTRRARVVHAVVVPSVLLLLVCLLIGVPLIFVQRLYAAVILVTSLALLLFSWWLLVQGRVRFAATVVVAEFWVILTAVLPFAGGAGGVLAVLYVAIAVEAGLLLGLKPAVWVGVLSAAATLCLAIADQAGVLPARLFPFPPLAGWLVVILSLVLTLIPFRLSWRQLADALAEARRQLGERTRAEEQLRTSEARYRLLAENTTDVIWSADLSLRFNYVSPSLVGLCGYAPDEFLCLPLDQVVTPESLQRSLSILAQQLRLEDAPGTTDPTRSVTLEVDQVRRDGGTVPVEIRASFLRNAAGQPTGIVGVTRDVTERKRVEAELLRTRALLEAAVAQSPSGILIADAPDVRIRFANAAALGIRGPTDQPLTDLEVSQHAARWQTFRTDGRTPYPPEELPLSRAVLEGITSQNVEVIIRRDDGEARWVSTNASPIRDASGQVVAGLAIFHDITEMRQTEEALRESEQRFRSLVEETHSLAVFGCDRQRRVLFWNAASEQLYGYPRAEAIGSQLEDLIAPLAQRAECIALVDACLTHGQPIPPGEGERKRRDGTVLPVFSSHVLLHNRRGEPELYCMELDLSERRRAAEEKARLEAQFLQAQKMDAMGRLAGGVAHDFNNLLQVMNGYTELARGQLGTESPVGAHLQQVARAGERAAQLVGQMLTFSRRQAIRPEHVDTNRVVDEFLRLLQRVIGEHIRVDFHPGPDLDTIRADRSQLEQVLMNLCVNARDAMPDGGTLTITTRNVLVESPGGEATGWGSLSPARYVVLSVADTGHGMDEETCQHIFEPFFTTKEADHGTGLGLATVYGVVQQHRGAIQVRSSPGEGTQFDVYWPVADTATSAGHVESPATIAPTVGGSETLLLAEDNEMVRDLAVNVLREAGYTVLTAADGEEALRVFRAHARQIELMVLDVVMPRLSGRGVYEALRDRRPGLRFLFASGYSQGELQEGFLRQEGIRFIPKPFAPETLLRAVREALDDPPKA